MLGKWDMSCPERLKPLLELSEVHKARVIHCGLWITVLLILPQWEHPTAFFKKGNKNSSSTCLGMASQATEMFHLLETPAAFRLVQVVCALRIFIILPPLFPPDSSSKLSSYLLPTSFPAPSFFPSPVTFLTPRLFILIVESSSSILPASPSVWASSWPLTLLPLSLQRVDLRSLPPSHLGPAISMAFPLARLWPSSSVNKEDFQGL